MNGILKIRRNKQHIGTFKFSEPNISEIFGAKLTYDNKVIKIKNKKSAKGEILEFNDQTFQFLDNEVREWPSKRKLIKVKIKNHKLYLESPEKEYILKTKLVGDILKIEFLKEPPNFILYLIAKIFYFFKFIILEDLSGPLEGSEKV